MTTEGLRSQIFRWHLQNFLGVSAVLPSTTAYKDMFGVGLAAFTKT